ncbi:hypothetical protein OBBRIDRAFT_793502 [Obba rivulosa]|uniref:Uncharacterized protein n=1 Tax=Obba rivulosa TaxID=1052685 RepID=A0A8E2DLV3_9APHY|nr:hypothetical protein OBBRIDRAFT_793502 [Obba rivulosa]
MPGTHLRPRRRDDGRPKKTSEMPIEESCGLITKSQRADEHFRVFSAPSAPSQLELRMYIPPNARLHEQLHICINESMDEVSGWFEMNNVWVYESMNAMRIGYSTRRHSNVRRHLHAHTCILIQYSEAVTWRPACGTRPQAAEPHAGDGHAGIHQNGPPLSPAFTPFVVRLSIPYNVPSASRVCSENLLALFSCIERTSASQ